MTNFLSDNITFRKENVYFYSLKTIKLPSFQSLFVKSVFGLGSYPIPFTFLLRGGLEKGAPGPAWSRPPRPMSFDHPSSDPEIMSWGRETRQVTPHETKLGDPSRPPRAPLISPLQSVRPRGPRPRSHPTAQSPVPSAVPTWLAQTRRDRSQVSARGGSALAPHSGSDAPEAPLSQTPRNYVGTSFKCVLEFKKDYTLRQIY